jgi:hypothetical protein
VLVNRTSDPRQPIKRQEAPREMPALAPPPPTPTAWVQKERPRSMRPLALAAVAVFLFAVPSAALLAVRHVRMAAQHAPLPTRAPEPPPPEPEPTATHGNDDPVPPSTATATASASVVVPTAQPTVAPRPTHARPPEQTPDAGHAPPRPSARPNDDDIPTMR